MYGFTRILRLFCGREMHGLELPESQNPTFGCIYLLGCYALHYLGVLTCRVGESQVSPKRVGVRV